MSRALWQAVLARAVDDALHGVAAVGSAQRNQREAAIAEARTFLTTPSQDLETVCTLAGLDPVAVMDRMRKQIAEAPSVEELARNPRVSSVSAREPVPRRRNPDRSKNNGRPNPTYTHNGETLTVREWAERTGLHAGTIRARLRSGASIAEALMVTGGSDTCLDHLDVRR